MSLGDSPEWLEFAGKRSFIAEQIQGWIGNLMRDLDAQDAPVDVDDVIAALKLVLRDLSEPQDFDAFLHDLNDGRGQE